MTEPDTSVEIADEPTHERSEDNSQQPVEDYVTETTIHEKEFSVSIEYDSKNPLHWVWSRDEGPTLSSVAGSLKEIQEWVENVNDEEWELDQFKLKTTIVAQRTEKAEDSPDEEECETGNSPTTE